MTKIKKINFENAQTYSWGDGCQGWWLKDSGRFSVISEIMPSNSFEKKHFHKAAEQFFYCLQGKLQIEIWDGANSQLYYLFENEGLVIPANYPHKVGNISNEDVKFLVISSPNSHQDRFDL